MSEEQRGKLKIFMGYAAGVGKTYAMLAEAQDRRNAGIDIVIGYFEPHGRKETIAKTEGLEIIPRRRVVYRSTQFEEMDTDAILARRPQVCVVDEFPHTNIPGSPRAKRWEDVELLLRHGIDVLTTMNIQHLESLNDQVFQISGVRVRETVPDWVVQHADEIVMVDVTPRALLHRLQRGVVYERSKAEAALQNFFRESTLVALRELALRQTAHEVDRRITPDTSQSPRKLRKILVLITENPKTAMLIRRARRVSDFMGAECFAVAVQPSRETNRLAQEQREAIERHLNFARNLHIETRVLEGSDIAEVLVDFARRNQITQIYLTRPRPDRFFAFLNSDPAQKIIALAKDLQIVIVSDRESGASSQS
jgi:two-component system sensor histidine kinase KdpD